MVLLGRREQFSMLPTDASDAKSRNALNMILKGTVLYKSPAGNALLGPTMQGSCSLSKPIYVAPVEVPKGFIRKNRLLSTAELFVDTGPDGSFLSAHAEAGRSRWANQLREAFRAVYEGTGRDVLVSRRGRENRRLAQFAKAGGAEPGCR
jgi:hypothetical protein